ncbi:probable RNA helicase armi [Papilio machaon]|uniref:probable RNA helicase armi n=1 Tax=Papilio machaon TaxID=76193 RepID=UPI001E66356F|nr:probable RNA helicase armi [Papilio machaon]
MVSYIASWFNYLFNKDCEEDNDDYKENYLAEQLVDLEYVSEQEEKQNDKVENVDIPNNAICFQRTGVITFKDDSYVLIDGMFYFDTSNCSCYCNVNDQVLYLGYKDANGSIVVVRILENKGLFWGEEGEIEENSFQVTEHILVAEVDRRENRDVYLKESDVKFNLDDVKGTFVPINGDWLEITCTIQMNDTKPFDISMKQILSVMSFKPLRTKITSAYITDWTGTYGTCDRLIYFDKNCLLNGYQPEVRSKVMVEAIESNQNLCTWRAIKLLLLEDYSNENTKQCSDDNIATLQLEKEKRLDVTYPLEFQNLNFNKVSKISLIISNNSDEIYTLNKWIILSNKRDSQVKVDPFLTSPTKIYPQKSIQFMITCKPKFLGKTKECLIMLFRGFQIKRFIEINIVQEKEFLNNPVCDNILMSKNPYENYANMRKIRKDNKSIVPGEKTIKPPAFVSVKLGSFAIPEKIWDVVLGDSEQTIHSHDYSKILERLELYLPCLSKQLEAQNYMDKWHTLLYMEEIQININMRSYDIPKVFLIRCQEYLCVEINGLAEKRPSLIIGDRVLVKDIWQNNSPQYEGFIHAIKGDLVLMKFNPQFHEIYNGSDVSVEFHFSRTIFRRAHQAINYAISNLGLPVLFPSQIITKKPQVSNDDVNRINWFNKDLNECQKHAVTNVLLGECRPMPYCIFGPPGTGKTITVVETILQILSHIPESRILVATPSNSAANLVTQRLIQYRNSFTGSVIRLIAHSLLDSDNIPDDIKPFCATLDIAKEETMKSKHIVKNGINLNCQKGFIGRHRITIGTCYCLGSLAQIGLPKGHFTHIIVDEAAQATEPEIMLPLTFIDKDSGQIILAGDPMQLGPVVLSKYCQEYGLDESFMSRILECYPYQKDYISFKNGYDDRLVTKLIDNYRSLEEVISLPSEMFYDSSLVAKIDRNQPWILQAIDATCSIFGGEIAKTGGIYVHGVRGQNLRAEDSPSWYNPQEASMVAFTTCKLLKKGVTTDDIGIITPYIAQIKYLRILFDSMGVAQPKIGTVEEFQGQERPIILISTVRSSDALVETDQKHTLGFVKNPKRLNVALTRAQVSVILFCNPHLLCLDSLWKRVIVTAINSDKYMGSDVPDNVICKN